MDSTATPPFRADHVGSLLRPPELHEARARFAAGELSADGLREVEDAAIAEAVRMQREVGLRSVTDGEFRRGSWHMDFIYALGGVHRVEDTLTVRFHNAEGDLTFTPAGLRVSERVHLEHPIFEGAFRYLQSVASADQTPKLTIPSPSMVHYRGGRAAIDPSIYSDLDEFWDDLSAAYKAQLAAMAGLGCTYLQLDDTSLAYLNDPAQRAEIAARGEDPTELHRRYIRTMNAALADRPAGMAITTHLCRGNFRSSWVATGGYEYVADALFNELNVDGFFLEFDDDRSGGFEPLRFVPPGKRVVLGLVTTKRGELERKDDLVRRIEAATRFVPAEQLCLSPQCGFSSTVEGNTLTRDEQKAKLALVVETAAEVWG
jgi:5-methyltetrahydropteroyltriglutamate--homocysteine methyltransferase